MKAGGLVGGQKKLDKNKDGKISGADFKMMEKGGAVKKIRKAVVLFVVALVRL